MAEADAFLTAFRGSFVAILRWPQLDEFWLRLKAQAEGWYVYAPGEAPPQETVSAEALCAFVDELDTLLRREHAESYCGVVYVDDPQQPAFIKIYDPNHLGSSCGSSGAPPPLPGWILSRLKPVDLPAALPPPANRRRWWQRLFG